MSQLGQQRERQKERERESEVSKSFVADPLCSTDRLVIEGSYSPSDGRQQLPKKLIDTHTLFAALLLPREALYPSSVKHYVNMFNPRAKNLSPTAMVSMHPILSSSYLSIQVRLGWRPVLCRKGEAFGCAIDFREAEYTV